MQELTLVGLSDDGGRLILALGDGRRFALAIDERLRAATRSSGRAGQMALPTETLRPRDVQARLRAGATPEEVAEVSGWPLDRVEAFAVPVMQERSYIAQVASSSMVSHPDGEAPLRSVVEARLAGQSIDPADLRWDAWRGEDGRWTVLLAYPAGRGDQVATWQYDTESRTLHPLDATAAELMAQPREEPEPHGALVEPDEPTARIVNLSQAKERASDPAPEFEASRHPALRRQLSQQAAEADSAAAEPSASERSAARSKRAQVPSWDEILFGADAGESDRPDQR